MLLDLYYTIYDYIYEKVQFAYEDLEDKYLEFSRSEDGKQIIKYIQIEIYEKIYVKKFLNEYYYPCIKLLTTGFLYKYIFGTTWYPSLLAISLVCFYYRQTYKLYKLLWWYIITVLYEEELVGKRYVSYLGMALVGFWWLGILNLSVLLTYHSWYNFGFYYHTFDFMAYCDYHFRWYFTLFRSTFFFGYPRTDYDHLFPDNHKARERLARRAARIARIEAAEKSRQLYEAAIRKKQEEALLSKEELLERRKDEELVRRFNEEILRKRNAELKKKEDEMFEIKRKERLDKEDPRGRKIRRELEAEAKYHKEIIAQGLKRREKREEEKFIANWTKDMTPEEALKTRKIFEKVLYGVKNTNYDCYYENLMKRRMFGINKKAIKNYKPLFVNVKKM